MGSIAHILGAFPPSSEQNSIELIRNLAIRASLRVELRTLHKQAIPLRERHLRRRRMVIGSLAVANPWGIKYVGRSVALPTGVLRDF